jgi:hypothetical protein
MYYDSTTNNILTSCKSISLLHKIERGDIEKFIAYARSEHIDPILEQLERDEVEDIFFALLNYINNKRIELEQHYTKPVTDFDTGEDNILIRLESAEEAIEAIAPHLAFSFVYESLPT